MSYSPLSNLLAMQIGTIYIVAIDFQIKLTVFYSILFGILIIVIIPLSTIANSIDFNNIFQLF